MISSQKFDELVLIGGYGENSRFSEELTNLLLTRVDAVAIITKQGCPIKSIERLLVFSGDMNDSNFIQQVFDELQQKTHRITAYIHAAGRLFRSPFLTSSTSDFREVMERNFFCAIEIVQLLINHAVQHQYHQHLVFIGATASLRGSKNFAAFSTAKFALRSFTQSLAREFSAQGIHVCHLIPDGIIEGKRAEEVFNKNNDDCIQALDFAELVWQIINQPSSAWTQELDLRPYNEKF